MTPDTRLSATDLSAEQLRRFRDFGIEVLEAAGRRTLAHFRVATTVDDKSAADRAFDPVTAADREAEALIRAAIGETFPDHGVLGEEGGVDAGTGPLGWTVDPVDGTRAFIGGFVHWGMLLALTERARPVLGLVHQPYTGELWTGSALGAEFRRGGETRAIATRRCAALGDALLATTDPYLFAGAEAEVFADLRSAVRLTRYGADCYAYCMLAMGRIDLVVESGLGPWDIQALMPLVQAAGGIVTDWRGGDCSGGGQVVAAGDPALHALALERLAAAAEDAR